MIPYAEILRELSLDTTIFISDKADSNYFMLK
jgi:hypothetical protein